MRIDKKHQPVDFSQSAIKKAVAKQTIEHPGVLYPAALSVLGGFAALLLELGPWFWGLAAGGVSLALISWGVNYGYRQDAFASQYVRLLHARMEEQRLSRKKQLEESLHEVASEEGTSQYQRLSNKFDALQRILAKKLNPGELTYARYLGMAEQVYLGGLDNLQNVTHLLSTLKVIDIGYIKKRLGVLQASGNPEQHNEIEALRQRLELYEEQRQKINAMLAQNEEAMTKIDLTIAAITDMRTQDKHASMDIESAMNELQQLAARAKNYSSK
jgi:hypothetical protein